MKLATHTVSAAALGLPIAGLWYDIDGLFAQSQLGLKLEDWRKTFGAGRRMIQAEARKSSSDYFDGDLAERWRVAWILENTAALQSQKAFTSAVGATVKYPNFLTLVLPILGQDWNKSIQDIDRTTNSLELGLDTTFIAPTWLTTFAELSTKGATSSEFDLATSEVPKGEIAVFDDTQHGFVLYDIEANKSRLIETKIDALPGDTDYLSANGNFSWTADHKKIIFSVHQMCCKGIFSINSDGSNLQQLTLAEEFNSNPNPFLDSKGLLYFARGSDTSNDQPLQVIAVNTITNEESILYSEDGNVPCYLASWQASESGILVVQEDCGTSPERTSRTFVQTPNIVAIDEQVSLPPNSCGQESSWTGLRIGVSWSPTSSKLALIGSEDCVSRSDLSQHNGKEYLYIVNFGADGSIATSFNIDLGNIIDFNVVEPNNRNVLALTWSSDGRFVMYKSLKGMQALNVEQVNAKPTNLSLPSTFSYYAWR